MSTQPPRRHARKEPEIDQAAKRRILTLLREGWGIRRIAKRFGIFVVTVERIRDEEQICRK